MADKTTRTEELVMVSEFRDGDDRSINLPNPKYDVEDATSMAQAGADINAIGANVQAKKLLIGDKAGADFIRFKSAKIVKKSVTIFDLTA